MKVTLDKIEGEVIKNDETYIIEDNNYLQNLTLSRTTLKPGQSTKGHFHENQEEVYIFTDGEAHMIIDKEIHHAFPGDTFLISKGQFHRVANKSVDETCSFTCIFEKYDRSGNEAKY